MPHTNLTLSQLADYLHRSEAEVKKLAERDNVPSRRVNGELVFSQDAVHRWIEQRIGNYDGNELENAETRFERSGIIEPEISIAALFPEGAMLLPMSAKTRDSAIRSMVQTAMSTGLLWDGDEMIEAVKAREELHTTALDNGVALLHPRRPMPHILGDTFLILGKLPFGIPFGGGSSNLTDIFFLICSTDDKIHLTILTRISRLLMQPDFLKQLRELETEDEIRELLRNSETEFGNG
ncbi:PTS fructose transporter subunit IIA [Planctomycetales bacterium]|nr:PTS fructose transporter subunit IIA [Planctomycetales bacterium]